MGLTELKSRCQQRWYVPAMLRHNPLLCLFLCVEAFQAVGLIAPTSIFKVIICSICTVSHFLPETKLATFHLLPPTFNFQHLFTTQLLGYCGFNQIIYGHLFIPRSSAPSARGLVPGQITWLWISKIRKNSRTLWAKGKFKKKKLLKGRFIKQN